MVAAHYTTRTAKRQRPSRTGDSPGRGVVGRFWLGDVGGGLVVLAEGGGSVGVDEVPQAAVVVEAFSELDITTNESAHFGHPARRLA